MNVVIIEDEPFSARRLQKLLLELRPSWRVVQVLDSVETSVQWLQTNAMPDLLLLDVRVADGISFEIFKRVTITAPVIFITAYDHYALQAFKINSIDYLLKPVDADALGLSLLKLEKRIATPVTPLQFDDKEFLKYSSVTEEERIFMFIDLNNSTRLAEGMGHVQYSKFLSLCFELLFSTINRYGAEIYQLVGDEVVVTWRADKAQEQPWAFHLFFAFEKLMLEQKRYFLNHFNAHPKFTASVHKGPVALSYVGNKLKDLAYHGDVLNTAARMLAAAKERYLPLVASSDFLQGVTNVDPFVVSALGELKCRGKSNMIQFFSVKAPASYIPANI